MMSRGVSEAPGNPGKITHLVLPAGKRSAVDDGGTSHLRASRQKRVALLLVDAMTLTRECLIHTLSAGARDFDVQGIARWTDIDNDNFGRKPDIVLLNINGARLAEHWVVEE